MIKVNFALTAFNNVIFVPARDKPDHGKTAYRI